MIVIPIIPFCNFTLLIPDDRVDDVGLSTDSFSAVAALETSTEQTVDREMMGPVLDRLADHLLNVRGSLVFSFRVDL